MNICQSTAQGLVSQIEEAFLEEKGLPPQDFELIAKETSEVYKNLKINSIKKELEGYLIGTAKNAVKNSDAVIGIGIMFEPYAFSDSRESYALYFTEENGQGKHVYSFFYPLKAGSEVWQTVTTVTYKDVSSDTIITALIQIGIALVSLIIIVAVTIRTLKARLSPIDDIVTAANRISQGDLDIQLSVVSRDEIGILAETFQNTCSSLKEMIRDVSNTLGEIAQNNFEAATNTEYKGEFVNIQHSIAGIVENLNHAMKEISESSGQVSIGAKQMADTSQYWRRMPMNRQRQLKIYPHPYRRLRDRWRTVQKGQRKPGSRCS